MRENFQEVRLGFEKFLKKFTILIYFVENFCWLFRTKNFWFLLWLQLLFSADPKLAENISGVILFHETLYQKAENGEPLVDLLKKRCIIPGIKVDCGVVNLFGSEDEVTTQGAQNCVYRSYFVNWKSRCPFETRVMWSLNWKISFNSPRNYFLCTLHGIAVSSVY